MSEERLVFHNSNSTWQKRNRKIDLLDFVGLFIRKRPGTHLSLNDMCQELGGKIKLSKQAIDKRINRSASELLRSVLEDVLAIRFSSLPLLKKYNSIILTDSTSFQLPARLNDDLKGFGGNHGMRAGAKVQYQMSLTGDHAKLSTVSASKSDQKWMGINPQKGELHLFDLGYFTFARLREFSKAKAFYVCRLKVNSNIYQKKNGKFEQLTWKQIAKKCKRNTTLELEVYLGEAFKVKTRLLVYPIDENQAAEKRKKVRRYAQRHSKQATQNQLLMCDFSVHITNIPKEDLPANKVREVYGLRWQIELQFKTWKSYMNIHKMYHVNIHRFNCHHYGSLIYILLCSRIFQDCKYQFFRNQGVELSELKAMKYMARNHTMVSEIIFGEKSAAKILFNALREILEKYCVKEAKKGKLTPMNIIKTTLS